MENEKRLIDANAIPYELCYVPEGDIQWEYRKAYIAEMAVIDAMPTVDAVEVVHKPLRVEVTTDDFTDIAVAKEKGYYRKHYFCPSCDIEIGHKTFDKHRQFGQGTVLHSNIFPNYCPNCGAKMDGDGNG